MFIKEDYQQYTLQRKYVLNIKSKIQKEDNAEVLKILQAVWVVKMSKQTYAQKTDSPYSDYKATERPGNQPITFTKFYNVCDSDFFICNKHLLCALKKNGRLTSKEN